tara:strand:+ start:3022 stop:3228 length:207 start_codon:yes stop_codon:yes gene_type:complete
MIRDTGIKNLLVGDLVKFKRFIRSPLGGQMALVVDACPATKLIDIYVPALNKKTRALYSNIIVMGEDK